MLIAHTPSDPLTSSDMASCAAVPAGPDPRLPSLSLTAASRGRSSGSGSRLWNAGAAVVRRFSVFGRSGLLSGSAHTPVVAPPQHALHLSVRIGIATGRLPYGTDLNTCAVKDRAKSECSALWAGVLWSLWSHQQHHRTSALYSSCTKRLCEVLQGRSRPAS